MSSRLPNQYGRLHLKKKKNRTKPENQQEMTFELLIVWRKVEKRSYPPCAGIHCGLDAVIREGIIRN